MSGWRALLSTPDSMLATALRYQLVGLRAGLAAALAERPDDPGAHAGGTLVAEIAVLLDTPTAATEPSGAPTDTAVGPSAADVVSAAVRELGRHPDAPAGWTAGAGADEPAEQRWLRMHLAALRMGPRQAGRWRAEADRLTAALPAPAGQPWIELPGREDAVLVPPFGCSRGLRTSTGATLDADVAACLGLDPGPSPPPTPERELAALATATLVLTGLDETLWLGLASVQPRSLTRFDDRLRAAYRHDMLARLLAYGGAPAGSGAAFRALLRVDEALNSVVHLPVAAPDSWWAQRGRRCRDLVLAAQQQHEDVTAQELTGWRYRQVREQTDGTDIGTDVGRTGEVLACLRMWARVGGAEIPGRVVYAG